MDIQAKLDAIQEQKEALLTLTPSEHKEKNLKKLYQDVLVAKSAAENAPFRVVATEKQYYIARDGADGYQQHLLSSYSRDGRSIRDKMLSQHNTQLDEVNQSISYYESVRTYLRNISDVQLSLLEKIRDMLNKIRMSEVETTNRKSYFLEKFKTSLSTRIVICNVFILSYVVLMISLYYDQLKNPVILGTLSLLLVVVFGLSFILKMITSLPISLNVYTEWGYDPLESKQQWYFIIPAGFVTLWFLVKYLS